MNNKGQAVIIIGLIAFVVSIFLYVYTLPLMSQLIDNALPNLGTVDGFLVKLLPFAVFFLLCLGLIRLIGGGE